MSVVTTYSEHAARTKHSDDLKHMMRHDTDDTGSRARSGVTDVLPVACQREAWAMDASPLFHPKPTPCDTPALMVAAGVAVVVRVTGVADMNGAMMMGERRRSQSADDQTRQKDPIEHSMQLPLLCSLQIAQNLFQVCNAVLG